MSDMCICMDVECEQGPDFCTIKIVTARKEHTCGECHEIIPAGAQYEYVAGCWEGRFDTHKTCIPCKRFRDEHFCDGFYYGMVWEDATETFRHMYSNDEDKDWKFMLPVKYR